MSIVRIESRVGDQEAVLLQAEGEYQERGHRGRLTYTWTAETENKPGQSREVLDLTWGRNGELLRVLRMQPGSRMEFIPGEETAGKLTTPAGTLDLKIKTIQLEGKHRRKSPQLYLEYDLSVAGQDQGVVKIKIQTEE